MKIYYNAEKVEQIKATNNYRKSDNEDSCYNCRFSHPTYSHICELLDIAGSDSCLCDQWKKRACSSCSYYNSETMTCNIRKHLIENSDKCFCEDYRHIESEGDEDF